MPRLERHADRILSEIVIKYKGTDIGRKLFDRKFYEHGKIRPSALIEQKERNSK